MTICIIDTSKSEWQDGYEIDLDWTREKPTKPGIYQAIRYGEKVVISVEVFSYSIVDRVYILLPGQEDERELSEFEYFLGPISLAEPPKE